MSRKYLISFGLASLMACTAALADDAQSVIGAASKELGVESLKSVQYSATGFDFAFGQAPRPGAPWPKFVDKSYVRTIDFQHPASQVNRVRVQGENPPRGGGGQPLVGEQSQTQTFVIGPDTPWNQQLEIWLLPQGFLRAAATRAATLTSRTSGGNTYRVVSFVGDNGAKVNGYIDKHDRIVRVETWIDTPVLGDTAFEADYSDYGADNGILFPRHIIQKQGGYPILDLTVSEVKINPAVSISAPVAKAGDATNSAQNPLPKSERLGEGVYLITGGYAVIAVEFNDHIVLLESGQNEARALAVIAEARRLIPGKPIKYVVNTHSHFDHSGGLRAFVAEGTTVLTYRTNKPYLESVLALPHTISPDKAQASGNKPLVEAVGEKRVLTDGTQVIELYHLQHFLHHDGMLVAYLPKEKVLFEADGYNPQAADASPPNVPSPFTLSLLDNVQRLNLDVQRIVPVHYPADGRVITLSDLRRWVGRDDRAVLNRQQ
jgi:glyoxylase-like metal-dependent hydrolase (beta-lactamase superfamily II)